MTLAASGTMSMGGSTSTRSINLELGLSATATATMGSAAFRTLADVSSGAISLSNFYGKSDATGFTVTQGSAGNGTLLGMSIASTSSNQPYGAFGSATPTTFGGHTITDCYWDGDDEFYICLASPNASPISSNTITDVIIPGISGSIGTADDNGQQVGSNFKRWGWYELTRPSVWDGSGDLFVAVTDAS
tara:strand:- start:1932 stop:2498 length:567 start_codon:yes stop_codon:yes gene_type:complete